MAHKMGFVRRLPVSQAVEGLDAYGGLAAEIAAGALLKGIASQAVIAAAAHALTGQNGTVSLGGSAADPALIAATNQVSDNGGPIDGPPTRDDDPPTGP